MAMQVEVEEADTPPDARERCAGLDVHRSVIVVCAKLQTSKGRLTKVWREYSTTAAGLAALVGCLREHGVSHVGMEATGVYWMPIYAALENAGGFDVTVVNPQHAKALRKRKTDKKDAEWLADLIRHDQVNKSFIPAKPFRVLRDLTRYRRSLVQEQANERRRLIKLLEAADIKLAGVMSDVFGVSGRRILNALISGGLTPQEMAKLACGQLRKKRAALAEALAVEVAAHRRFLFAMALRRIEATEAGIADLDKLIAEHLAPYDEHMRRLMTIPGIDWVIAAIIIAEIGVDLSAFPTAGHLAAWVGTCPGNNESAGKRRAIGARDGNPYLKTALCNAATSAARKRNSFYQETYHRIKSRRGGGRATLTVAHKLTVAIYHMFTRGTDFKELGANYADTRNKRRSARRYVDNLRRLGFDVVIQPRAKAA